MRSRVDVEILGGKHVAVAVRSGQQGVDGPRNGGTACDGQRPALAEVVLHIDDDQRPHVPTVTRKYSQSADPRRN